jgi:hypothetical protein
VSGYLARLARGIDGAEPGVRPHLPSIFEVVGAGLRAPIVGLAVEEVEPADERPSRVPNVSAERLVEPRETSIAARAVEPGDRAMAARLVESAPRQAPPSLARSVDRRDEAAEPRAVAGADEPADRSEPPGRIPIRAAVEAPSHAVAPPPLAAPGPEASPVPARAPKGVPTLDPIPRADVDRTRAAPPVPPRTQPPTAVPVRSDGPRPPAVSVVPAAALAPAPLPEPRRLRQSGPAESPVVRITIGRIDVRAVPTPTPNQENSRPTRRKPAMSLEDYLERRNGRRS